MRAALLVVESPWAIAAFVAYLALVVFIGVRAARFSSTGLPEFFLAGRKLKRWVVALSAVVSGRSSWLLLGMTGIAWARGVSAIWAVVGYIVVELFLFLFYASRLRRITGRLDNLTLPDFFESRLGDRSGVLRSVTALVVVVFLTVYVAGQFTGGGKALASSFGMEHWVGVLATAGIVLVYTVLGGFLAVSLTDMVQAILMILALVVVPFVAILDYGGLAEVVRAVGETGLSRVDPFSLGAGAFFGFLGIGLGSPGNPHILVRYMSIDDPKQLRVSALIGTVWNVIMAWGAIYVGLVGRAYHPTEASLPGADPESVFPALAQEHLPPFLFGLVVASIFAAIMSTCDSQLLVAASCLVRDFFEKTLRRGRALGQRSLVWLSRATVAALVVVAVGIEHFALDNVFWLVLAAWAGLGAAFGPTSILALFWRGTTRWGALAGIVVGTAVVFGWEHLPFLSPAARSFYELVPAFFLSLAATILFSLATRPPADAEEQFRIMRGEEG